MIKSFIRFSKLIFLGKDADQFGEFQFTVQSLNGRLFLFLRLILSFSYLTSHDSASLDLIDNYKTSREAGGKIG